MRPVATPRQSKFQSILAAISPESVQLVLEAADMLVPNGDH
jgi:hypothetical protein